MCFGGCFSVTRYNSDLDSAGFEQQHGRLRERDAGQQQREDDEEHEEAQELDEALEALARADALFGDHLGDVPQPATVGATSMTRAVRHIAALPRQI